MVDIHCHILPGLDDGPDSLDVALEMAEMAIADGITHVVATPHASGAYQFLPELIRQRQDEIQTRVAGRLTLATGCDFHMSFENLQDIREQPNKYTINQKNYLLVEFDEYALPAQLDQSLHELQLAGIQPIVTHPERNAMIRNHPHRLDQWIEHGCRVQLTAQSLLGGFGPRAQAAAEAWLDGGRVHFISSDAHNTTSRPLRLKEAFGKVAERWGHDVAQALVRNNPLAAFEGRPLPYVPELFECTTSSRRRKRFWFF